MSLKKVHKLVEAVNDYYAFSLLAYAAVLYVASHHHAFFWILGFLTPFLAGWTGYLLKSYLDNRSQQHGVRMLSDVMTYEIKDKHSYTLRYATKIKAMTSPVMIYPKAYQWTGQGKEYPPKVTGKGQQLLSPIEHSKKDVAIKISPYESTNLTTEGDWHYWFIALNPPLYKGDTTVIKYSQEFFDKKGQAKPYLYYFVRRSMERLELNVKFPSNDLPTKVGSSFIKPSDPHHQQRMEGVKFDPEKQWATLVIHKPKRGYCYIIHWQ